MSMAMLKGGGVGVVSSKSENVTTSGSLLHVSHSPTNSSWCSYIFRLQIHC